MAFQNLASGTCAVDEGLGPAWGSPRCGLCRTDGIREAAWPALRSIHLSPVAGIRCARGEYGAFLDSDDSWLPQYLDEQIKFLADSQQLDMVYSDALVCGEDPLSGKRYFEERPPRLPPTFLNLLQGSFILSSNVDEDLAETIAPHIGVIGLPPLFLS